MDTIGVTFDRAQARELYRQYKAHRHYDSPIDHEVQRAYQLLAQGRLIIKAIESIGVAGLNDQGLPKLAIVRAHAAECWLTLNGRGGATFSEERWTRAQRAQVELIDGSFPGSRTFRSNLRAIVPLIPAHLGPRRGLANYHILFEAEWTPVPPRDPLLLRRIGKADLWLVVAAWDLTEVERAALAARIRTA